MKKTLLLVSLLVLPLLSFGQYSSNDTITFEKNSNLVHIDTSQHPNLWQIGRPQKTYLDSAYSKPYAIITDTINPYQVNNVSSFTIGFKPPESGSVTLFLEFWQKYELDSLHAIGYVEISSDTGKTWSILRNENIVFDTIFTGNSNGWQMGFTPYCAPNGGPIGDSILYRFTFKSDSVAKSEDGWEIDNISLYAGICEGIQEVGKDKGSIQIYPNPASSEVSLIYNFNSASHKASLNLYNPVGQLVRSEPISHNVGTITEDVSALPDGIYYYRLLVNGVPAATSKLVIIK